MLRLKVWCEIRLVDITMPEDDCHQMPDHGLNNMALGTFRQRFAERHDLVTMSMIIIQIDIAGIDIKIIIIDIFTVGMSRLLT